jgi:hypothetical protein
MKLFKALGGVQHRFTTDSLQITPQQDKLLIIWLSKKASYSDSVELKTDLHYSRKNIVSASATTA